MGGREGVGMWSRRHRQRSNTVSWCPLWYVYFLVSSLVRVLLYSRNVFGNKNSLRGRHNRTLFALAEGGGRARNLGEGVTTKLIFRHGHYKPLSPRRQSSIGLPF